MNIENRPSSDNGFSLIELLIVIAIMGIMAAVAIPSYTDYMLKSRRVDATSFLTEVASEQVRFYSEYNRYTGKMSELGYGDEDTADSKEGHYTVSIVVPADGQSYTLTATPLAGSPQAKDDVCANISLTSSSQRSISGTGEADTCW